MSTESPTRPTDPAPPPAAEPQRRPTTTHGERPSLLFRVLATAVMVLAAAYFLLPVYWMVVASTKSTGQLFSTPGFEFADLQLGHNLAELSRYDGGIYWRWVANTVVYSVIGSVLTVAVCATCGYALAVFRFRGRAVVLAAVLGSMLVPNTVLAQPIYLLVVELGLNNTYWGVLLPSMVFPFGVLLCTIYAQSSIPTELLEAARLDGAGELRIFFQVVLPLSKPVIAVIALFYAVTFWNEWFHALLYISEPAKYPLQLVLQNLITSVANAADLGTVTAAPVYQMRLAMTVITIGPILLAYPFAQRYFVKGLTLGATKG